MSLSIVSEGSSKLTASGNNLIFSQDGLASFQIRPNKIIKNADYIFCGSYTFRKDTLIPIFNCWFKGSGTATINLSSQTHTVSSITAGDIAYRDYIGRLLNVLSQSEVTATYKQSACKSNVTDSTILTSEQTACLQGANFDSTKYSLSNQAPSVSVSLTEMTATLGSPIGMSVSAGPIFNVSQSSVTSCVYYSVGVVLSWAS